MTTELTVVAPGVTDLTPTDMAALIEAELVADREANAFEFQPVRVKMPSGTPPYRFNAGDEAPTEITGIIVVGQVARAYWPGKDALNMPPVCSSPDGVRGWLADSIDPKQMDAAQVSGYVHPGLRSMDAERGPYQCDRCPLSAWGSGNGRGQACKSLRRLLILIDGWSMPAVLTLPPTSAGAFDTFASARASKKKGYFTCKVRLALNEKENANKVKFASIRIENPTELTLTEMGTVYALRQQYSELVRRMEITASDYAGEENVPF